MNTVRLSGGGVLAKASTNPSGTKAHLTLEMKTAVASLRASDCWALSPIPDRASVAQDKDGIRTITASFAPGNKLRNICCGSLVRQQPASSEPPNSTALPSG